MLGYLNYIRLTDGQHSVCIKQASEVTIRNADGKVTRIRIGDFDRGKTYRGGYAGQVITAILGHTTKQGNRLMERLSYGVGHTTPSAYIPYRKGSWTALHGAIKRREILFGDPGVCHTKFTNGGFKWQAFYWQDGSRAYSFKRTDGAVTLKRKGKVLLEYVGQEVCAKTNWESKCEFMREGYSYFGASGYDLINNQGGKDYAFKAYDGRGKVKTQGEFTNRQRTGEWIVNGKTQRFLNGVMVDDWLFNAKAEDIPAKRVLTEKNAQVRSILIAKLGVKRLIEQLKGKVIDTHGKNRLLELPIAVDDGNGNENGSRLRVLDVVCPSTAQHYLLQVPDFVWDNGRKTRLDTCEQARMWGFKDKDDEEIEFIKET